MTPQEHWADVRLGHHHNTFFINNHTRKQRRMMTQDKPWTYFSSIRKNA